MPVTEIPEHIVVWAYRLILGRDAESTEVIRSWQSMGDPRLLTRHFIESPEHRQGRDDPNFAPPTLPVPDALALDAWHWLRHGRPAPAGARPIRSYVALREALLQQWPEPPALEPDEELVEIEARTFRRLGTLVYVELNIWTQLRFAGANPLRVLEAWASRFPHVVRFTEDGPRPVVGTLAQQQLVHDILMSPHRHDDIVLCFDPSWMRRWE